MMVSKPLLNGKKRNSIDIERDILEYLIMNPGGEYHTNLLFKCNLSFIQSNHYFDKMVAAGFIIKTVAGKRKIKITKIGIERFIQLKLLRRFEVDALK
jgi:predicted transcriptional regulator